MEDYCGLLLGDFIKNSWLTIKVLVEKLASFKSQKLGRRVTLFHYINGQKMSVTFQDDRFFLRGSVEYSNPQLTVEAVQGIIGTRLLEVCANYFDKYGLHEPNKGDVSALCELLKQIHALFSKAAESSNLAFAGCFVNLVYFYRVQ